MNESKTSFDVKQRLRNAEARTPRPAQALDESVGGLRCPHGIEALPGQPIGPGWLGCGHCYAERERK